MSSETVAVIGGGPGGLRAAQGIAELGGKAVLIEQRGFLGGTPVAENYCGLTPRGEPAQPQIRQMVDLVTANPLIEVRLGTEVAASRGGTRCLHTRTASRRDGRDQVEWRRRRSSAVRSSSPRASPTSTRGGRPRCTGTTSSPTSSPSLTSRRCCRRDGCYARPMASHRSGSASSSASAAATARSATSTARRCAAGWPRKKPSRSGSCCRTPRCSSSTSTCGCTAIGRTRSTGRPKSSTTSSTSRG